MAKLRVAVIGCGNVSGGHIRAWLGERDRAEIVALFDVAGEFARERKEEFELTGARLCTSYEEVLAAKDIDVVDLCTPSHCHADEIAAALEAGKHIVTEKPTGYNLEECRRLRWFAQRYPEQKVAVAYSLRYYPLNMRVRELVQTGAIGSILFAEAAHNHPHDFSAGSKNLDTSGPRSPRKTNFADKGGRYLPGAEMTGATHVFDLMRYLFGEVRDVFSFRSDCCAFALMRFDSGMLGKATAANAAQKGIATPHVLCIQGTHGTIYTQNEHQYSDKGLMKGYNGYLVTNGTPEPIDVAGEDTSHGDRNRTRNFLDAVARDEPLICSLDDGIRTSELLHAIWDSHNLEIRVPVHRVGKSG